MKIGDKVRFLNESGGGRVTGFQGRNIVLVEDNDGFEIPFPINEVVIVDNSPEEVKPKQVVIEPEPAPDVTAAEERDGGDKPSVSLAYVPVNIKELSTTNLETYIVNDCNYYIRYVLLTAENNNWTLKSMGEIEPNTLMFIEEFGKTQLNDYSQVCLQVLAYKKDKPFSLVSPRERTFRVDPMKFYKLHSYVENDFFDVPAMLFEVYPSAEDALDELRGKDFGKDIVDKIYSNKKKSADKSSYVRRYDNGHHSANPFVNRRHNDEKIVVDLHAHELLETTHGMTNADILNYQLDIFRRTLEENRKKKGTKIVFIHGKGEGVLRQAIVHELQYRYKSYSFQDASFQEYGYGATQVTIH